MRTVETYVMMLTRWCRREASNVHEMVAHEMVQQEAHVTTQRREERAGAGSPREGERDVIEMAT